MSPGASPVARIRRFSSASFLNKSQLMRDSSLFVPMPVLETSGLTLRRFCEDDVDLLSGLMANQDFMRFSLGVYTQFEEADYPSRLSDKRVLSVSRAMGKRECRLMNSRARER